MPPTNVGGMGPMPTTKAKRKAIIRKIKRKAGRTPKKFLRGGLQRPSVLRKRLGAARVYGRGGYFTDAWNAVSRPFMDNTESVGAINQAARAGLGGLATAAGSSIGLPAGISSMLGKYAGNAGSWLSRALGFGAYSVSKNSLLSSVEGSPNMGQPPSFGSTGMGSDIIFSHREFIANVTSSTAFSANTYPINPGNPIMFPWLSSIASLFEEYEMLGMLMEFKSTCATAVGTTSAGMGVVIMATDYDCYDANYSSKRAMEAAEFSSSAVPYETFLHPIECDPKRNVLKRGYVVPGMTAASQASGDQRMSVLGNFTIATQGQQTSTDTIGELWVTYHVRLSRPILEGAVSPQLAFTQHIWGTSTISGGVTVVTGQTSFGQPAFDISTSGTAGSVTINVANTTNGLTGKYFIQVVNSIGLTSGGWTSIVPAFPTCNANCSVASYTLPSLNSTYAGSAPAVATVGFYSSANQAVTSAVINFNAAGASVQMPLITTGAAASNWNVIILPVNLGLTGSVPKKLTLENLQEQVASLQASAAARPYRSKREEDEESDDEEEPGSVHEDDHRIWGTGNCADEHYYEAEDLEFQQIVLDVKKKLSLQLKESGLSISSALKGTESASDALAWRQLYELQQAQYASHPITAAAQKALYERDHATLMAKIVTKK